MVSKRTFLASECTFLASECTFLASKCMFWVQKRFWRDLFGIFRKYIIKRVSIFEKKREFGKFCLLQGLSKHIFWKTSIGCWWRSDCWSSQIVLIDYWHKFLFEPSFLNWYFLISKLNIIPLEYISKPKFKNHAICENNFCTIFIKLYFCNLLTKVY